MTYDEEVGQWKKEMDELLSAVKGLPSVKQRAVAALLGAVVADAAGSTLLWIYKDEDMIKAVSEHPDKPEFHNPSSNPFYHVPCGSLSHYGDQILPILRSLAECKDFDPANYHDQLVKAFGKGSPYERDYSGNIQYPIEGPYQNSTIKRFNQLYPQEQSAVDVKDDTNNEPDCIGRTVPVVMKWAGTPELQLKAEQCTTLLQTSEVVLTVVGVVARLLELYIVNGEPADAAGTNASKLLEVLRTSPDVSSDQKDFAELLQQVVDHKNLTIKEATQKFGKGCGLPGSFQSSFRSLLDEKGYVPAVREVILAGGSNCSRLILVGSCLGAKYGVDCIPRDWIDRTSSAKEVIELALEVMNQ